jgi:uncharacterized membrane protein
MRAKAVAGILLILPVGITVFALQFLFRLVEGIFAQPIAKILSHFLGREITIPGLGVLSFLVLIYVAGIIATNVVGRGFAYLTDRFFTIIPLAKSIYSATKQLTIALAPERRETFRQTVLVEFPKAGSYTIGFMTNEFVDGQGKAFVSVFIPTTPNPTSGYMLIVPKEKAIPSALSIEAAIQSVMSGGFALPSRMKAVLPFDETFRFPDKQASSYHI